VFFFAFWKKLCYKARQQVSGEWYGDKVNRGSFEEGAHAPEILGIDRL
jgi:hypothetical protein